MLTGKITVPEVKQLEGNICKYDHQYSWPHFRPQNHQIFHLRENNPQYSNLCQHSTPQSVQTKFKQDTMRLPNN